MHDSTATKLGAQWGKTMMIQHPSKKKKGGGEKRPRKEKIYPVAGCETDHPDRLPHQLFYGNYTKDDFNNIEYQSKKLGSGAYRPDGTLCDLSLNLHPVFVDRSEYKQKPNLIVLPQDLTI